MSTLSPPAIPDAAPRRRLLAFAGDLGLTLLISGWAAVSMTLAAGRPDQLFNELIVSICIGMVALLVVLGLRRAFWRDPVRQRRWRYALLAMLVPAAPVVHYLGLHIGSLILGLDTPDLAHYFTVPRVSMILFTMLGCFGLLGIILARERMDRIKLERSEAHARAETVERQALQAQLRLLQAQIEPHMLFNTLANLQGLIAIDPQRAGQMLDQLIQYLRATLSVSRDETTTLEQEFAAQEAYLGLMQVRMGARLAYRCSLPEELRTVRLPTMLLQPLVENAIVHGLEPKVDGGTVTIAAARNGDILEISVRDTGLGLGSAPSRKGTGVGVATTRERLQVLYGARANVELSPAAPQGAVARIHLPLEFP
jgi:anti-sigma regulatory factor (Ser/Thr protein kinase)